MNVVVSLAFVVGLFLVGLLGAVAAQAETYGKITGHVITLRINDLNDKRLLEPNERRHAFYVRLDAQPDMVLGFNPAKDSSISPVQQAMFKLLQDALANNWTVEIRWRSPVITLTDRLPPHATMLSVAVSMPMVLSVSASLPVSAPTLVSVTFGGSPVSAGGGRGVSDSDTGSD